jgi:hypothetical protein
MNWDEVFSSTQNPVKTPTVPWDVVFNVPGTENKSVPQNKPVSTLGGPASTTPTGMGDFTKTLVQDEAIKLQVEHNAGYFHDQALKMTEYDPFLGIELTKTQNSLGPRSINKVRKAVDTQFATEIGRPLLPEEVRMGTSQLYESSRQRIIDDAKNKHYNETYARTGPGPDMGDRVSELMTQEVYEVTNPLLTKAQQDRVSIMAQIRTEKDKTFEEGRDLNKIKDLTAQLRTTGETFINEDGAEIDVKGDPGKLDPKDKAYYDVVTSYFKKFEVDAENAGKLKGTFEDAYFYYQGLKDLYADEIQPIVDQQSQANQRIGAYRPYGTGGDAPLTERQRAISEELTDAKAKLTALSMLFLANENPLNVKKNLFSSGVKNFASGILGNKLISAVYKEAGGTTRDLLDQFQAMDASGEVEFTPEQKKHMERTFAENVVENTAALAGLLPMLAVAGGVTGAASKAWGLAARIDAVGGSWVVGKGASTMTRLAARSARILLEEVKMLPVFGTPTLGATFGAVNELTSGALPPGTPRIIRLLAKFTKGPGTLTIAQNLSALSGAWFDASINHKDIQEEMSAVIPGFEEIGSQLIANFVCGFGIPMPKSSRPELLKLKNEFKMRGDLGGADFVDIHMKQMEYGDKMGTAAYEKGMRQGKTKEEAEADAWAARDQALVDYEAKAKLQMEERHLIERPVSEQDIPTVLKNSKVTKDLLFNGSNAVFNRWDHPKPLNFFFPTEEAAGTQGSDVSGRHIRATKPLEVGNLGKISQKKIKEAQEAGHDALTGYVMQNGEKVPVVATFGSRGIIKPEATETTPQKLRAWGKQVQNTEVNMEGIMPASFLPVNLKDAAKGALKVMGKVIEKTGDVMAALDAGVKEVTEKGWYKQADPEFRAKLDPEIRKRLNQYLEEARPEAVAKYDIERATKMEKEVKDKYLPGFTKELDEVAAKFDAETKIDIKKPENTVGKKKREGLSDVTDVSDALRGAIIVNDLKQFKAVAKELKAQGYDIHNKRVADKTGYRGVYATKRNGELGTEVQIHTPGTLDAQTKAFELYKDYRDNGKPKSTTEEPDAAVLKYEQDIAESNRLFDEAYADLDDTGLLGSPARTAQDKKMKALELPTSVQKELRKSWTETKQKLLAGIKEQNSNIKEQFESYIQSFSSQMLGKLGIPLRKAMLTKVNKIDFTKPESLSDAIDYFEKLVGDATYKYDVIAYQKELDGLDKRTTESYLAKKAANGILKNKVGPTGLDLWDELKAIRKDMVEGDWNEGQNTIQDIYAKYMNNDLAISPEDYAKITRESFKGLLNITNGADKAQLAGSLRDLKEIIKVGKTEATAKRMAIDSDITEFRTKVFNILDGKPGKPVVLDELEKANIIPGKLDHILTWYSTSSWDSLMEILSKYDKSSKPYESDLSKAMVGSVINANLGYSKSMNVKQTEVQNKFKEIFGVTSVSKMRKLEHENSRILHSIEYKDLFGNDKTLQITMNQAYKVWMELQDPSLRRSNEAPSKEHDAYMRNGELTELGQKIENLLTPEVKAWADWQLKEFYPKYYDRINEVYRRKFGVDMPLNEFYSPIFVASKFSEGGVDQESVLTQQNALNTGYNAHLKTRLNHANKLALMDGDRVLINYIEKMEHFVNWTDAIDLINNVFVRDGNIREAVRQNFGQGALEAVRDFSDDFARVPKASNGVIRFLNNFRKNYTVASLALKPNIFFTQLTAMPAYLEQAPILQYAKNMWLFDAETRGMIKDIYDSEFMRERYREGGGWDWTVAEAMKADIKALNTRGGFDKFKNWSMFMTKYGDMASTLMGGAPLYKYVYKKTLQETGSERVAKLKALDKFIQVTRSSQQAGEVYDLSAVQRNPYLKMATMYRTAPMQYHRNVSEALRNAYYGRGSLSFNLKSVFIYHVLLPSLFQFVGNGFHFKKEDQIRAAVMGNFNEVFVAGDVVRGIMNTIRGLPFEYQISPLETTAKSMKKAAGHIKKMNLNDLVDAVLAQEGNVSSEEFFAAVMDLSKVAGDVSGLPVSGLTKSTTGLVNTLQGKTENPLLEILGWSANTLKDNSRGAIMDQEGSWRENMETTKPSFEKMFQEEDKVQPGTKFMTPQQKRSQEINAPKPGRKVDLLNNK